MITKKILYPLFLSTLISSNIYAQEFLLKNIQVQGLQRVGLGSVLNSISINVGDKIDKPQITNSIRELFKTGYFDDISAYMDDNIITLKVRERPLISEIKISGNSSINNDDMLKSLATIGLAKDEIFQKLILNRVKSELENQYHSQGRYNVQVKTEIENLDRNRVNINLEIYEGEVAKISHFNIIGNKVFSEDTLRNLMDLKTTNWLSWFKSDDKYSKDQLESDVKKIKAYYMDRGYINANIENTQVALTTDKKHVYITISINEGKKYEIGRTFIEGNDLPVDKTKLEELNLASKGDVFSQKAITNSIDLMKRILGDHGYSFAKINSQTIVDDINNTVDIIYKINPGTPIYINRIDFKGNVRTKDSVLRRELRQQEGALASSYQIQISKERLERLGYFKTVNMTTKPIDKDLMNVTYEVEEASVGSINATLGYDPSSGINLSFGISQDNFLGTGNYIELSASKSAYQNRYSFSITDPYFTKDGIGLNYGLFYRKIDYEKIKNSLSNYAMDSYGGNIAISYPISENTRIKYGITAQKNDIHTGLYTSNEVFDFLRKEGSKIKNITTNISLSTSTLNRGIFPTSGMSNTIKLETTIPKISDLNFYKTDASINFYKEITNQISYRLHGEVGYGNSFGKTSKFPFFENYYAGGIGSVRGFQDSALGPTSTPSDGTNPGTKKDSSSERTAFGGNFSLTGGAELILPIPFIEDQSQLRAVAFVDIGNTFDTNCYESQKKYGGCEVKIKNLASSFGVGLTWLTFLGPLNFSLSKPIKNPDKYDTKAFQFTLGQTF